MPELPEVETVRRELEPQVVGQAIGEAGSHWSAKFTPAVDAIGATITGAGRRGKFLLLPLSDDRELVIHLGMTGKLSFADRLDPDGAGDPYLRAWWQLDDHVLLFHDVRRFGRIRIVPTGDYRTIPTLANAGPEPWDPALTAARFHASIARSKRAVKTQLLSQRPVAGVGNIYADEALWAAQINPKVSRLGLERAGRLLDEVRNALEQGIENGGTTLRDYRNLEGGRGQNQHLLQAYGRTGLPCRRCDTPLTSEVIDARTTVWCPRCQRR
ncbi:MAG: bifunctional DNA-formamidopyrimidine glycosylase/DNA-(apurinic or apyrimidinic site) lyase [Acidimicrobiales bacterium]|nr:bifunctional DNA-formamidopyrimidine glycosylase/DNA-(apurinic or apyrimidinic site) lyase [Acidimicrobiales bacterium]